MDEQMERQGNVPKQIGKPQNFDGVRPLENIFDEEYSVKIEGHIFSKEVRTFEAAVKFAAEIDGLYWFNYGENVFPPR